MRALGRSSKREKATNDPSPISLISKRRCELEFSKSLFGRFSFSNKVLEVLTWLEHIL